MIKIHPTLINFVKPDAHSKFSPSSADRWWDGCSYSMKASEGIVEEENKYAAEGTMAHSVCEALFRQKEVGIAFPTELSMEMLTLSDNGEEMMQAAEDFYEVTNYWTHNKEVVGDVLWFGQERAIPIFPEESCYGTGDFVIVGSKASVVIDFKYGRKPVSADCKQLKAYASGVARHLDNLPKDGNGNVEYKIYAVIFQPRVGDSIKEFSYTVQEMYEALKDIWHWIGISKKDDLEPIEGQHCFWCPARRTKDIKKRCKAILEKPLKLAQENFAKFLADSNLTPDTSYNKAARDEAIIKLMTLLPAIEEVVKQCEDDFLIRMTAGEAIPGIVVANKYGRRILNAESDDDAAAMITQMFPGIDPWRTVTKKSIRTLGDMEKELGKDSLNPLCMKKVSKEVKVLDLRAKAILDSLSQYAINISRS